MACALTALCGCARGGAAVDTAASATPVPGTTSPFVAVRSPVPRAAPPVRLRIPALGVDAPVTALGLLADGSIEVPGAWGDVGWWSGGPSPGEPGPAALLGHVDSRAGPAVFARLHELPRGQVVRVVGADGVTRAFTVRSVQRFAKARFPTDEVYLPTLSGQAELRLITCGGAFDRAAGHYVDNVVAFAVALPEPG